MQSMLIPDVVAHQSVICADDVRVDSPVCSEQQMDRGGGQSYWALEYLAGVQCMEDHGRCCEGH